MVGCHPLSVSPCSKVCETYKIHINNVHESIMLNVKKRKTQLFNINLKEDSNYKMFDDICVVKPSIKH